MRSYYSQWISKYSETVAALIQANRFPLPKTTEKPFEYLKTEVENTVVYSIYETVPLTVETDASCHTVAASLNQSGRPVAFFSRTLSTSERKHCCIEKEAQATVEALRKWRHYLTS